MTLYFRLILILFKSLFRRKVNFRGPILTHFRVWPSDLDIFGHMTNARYFSLMDVARTDLLARTGLMGKLRELGWYPVVVEESMHFRRALLPFVKFQIKTEITGYDDRHLVLRQTFIKKDKVVALGIVRARFLGPDKQKIPPQELLSLSQGKRSFESSLPQSEVSKYAYHQEVIEAENALL